MPTYTKLTEDEKTAIQEAAVRSLEYQMYALEVEKIAEKQAQITAVLA
jgi:hypothetical protein